MRLSDDEKRDIARAAAAVLPPGSRVCLFGSRVDDAKRGMENALRAKPLEVKEQYERQIKDLQEAYGEAMLELRARKKLNSMLGIEGDK